jgi:predicted acylesterase/phospholipase RssA
MASNSILILAIDGGGIRGIIPAYILTAIEAKLGMPCYRLFDMIGGTSTGGIIAAGLTTPQPGNNTPPFSAQQLLNIYANDGGKIFVPQNCKVAYCATYFADDGNGNGIEPYLQQTVGATTSLATTAKKTSTLPGARVKHMFTTGYAVNSTDKSPQDPIRGVDYGPYLFNWYDAVRKPADNYYVWEAARGTSAAPVYFPIAHVGGSSSPRSGAAERWIIDGGTMSNNPAVWGLSEAFRTGLATDIKDITIISLGTGMYPGGAGVGISDNATYWDNVPADGNWSETPWLLMDMYDLEGNLNSRGTLVNIILEAVQLVSSSQLSALTAAGLKYYRMEPELTQALAAMDNITPQNIQALAGRAQQYLQNEGAATFNQVINALMTT